MSQQFNKGLDPNLPAGGVQGQVLVKNSSTNYNATWQQAPLGVMPAFSYTAASTLTAGSLALASASGGAFSLTLPPTPTDGAQIVVKKTDSTTSAVTVLPNTGQTINGSTSLVLPSQEAAARLVYNASGTRWMVVDTAAASVASNVITVGSGSSSGGSGGSVSSGGMFFPWTGAGRVFTQPIQSLLSTAAPNSYSNYALFFPVMVPNACTVASLSVFVPSNGGYYMTLGLYTDIPTASSGGPGVLISGSQVLTNANAAATVSINYAFTQPTPVWVSIGCNASIPVVCTGNTNSAYSGGLQNMVQGPLSGQQLYDRNGYTARNSTSLGPSAAASYSNVSSYSMSAVSSHVPVFYFTIG